MPKNPRLAGVATSTSITPSRISKSLTTAAAPSSERHFRPWYSITLACPCRSQRGESAGTERVWEVCEVWEWAARANRTARAQRARCRSIAASTLSNLDAHQEQRLAGESRSQKLHQLFCGGK